MSKKKLPGHYCKICGERKSNESFTGKGHAKHICKVCAALPQERKNELQYINRIDRIAMKYPRSREDWELLNKYALNRKYPEAAEFARMVLEMSGRIPQGKGKQAKNQSGKPILPVLPPETDDEYIFDDGDIDCMPVFRERKKFSELDSYEKMILRDYIRSAITEYRESLDRDLNENELIEIRKQMILVLEEECNITLKNDAVLRQFFQTNATNIINKLRKKKEDSR